MLLAESSLSEVVEIALMKVGNWTLSVPSESILILVTYASSSVRLSAESSEIVCAGRFPRRLIVFVVQVASLFFLLLVLVESFFGGTAGLDAALAFITVAFFLLLGATPFDGCFVLLLVLDGGSISGSGVSGLVSRKDQEVEVEVVATAVGVPS
jgi:hypothetical protein